MLLYTDNFLEILLPPALKNSILFCASHRNRILLGGKLIMNFQKQYELLSNLPPQARAICSSEAEQKAINEKWWCVLYEARTIFEQNNE